MPKKKPESPAVEPINTYGRVLVPGMSQLDYDRMAFAKRIPVDEGAPCRYELFRKIAQAVIPGHFEWHEWTEKMLRAVLPDDGRRVHLVGMSGCSGSAKSFTLGSFAAIWWSCWPNESSVTLVSTTKSMLRRRIWSEVQRVYSVIRQKQEFGNFLQSQTMWQATKGDDKHAIIGQAVEEGSVEKVADNIKGVHTKRQLLVIDEATSIPQAIFRACENLYAYPDEFILVVLGNAWSRLDQHGLFCEPDEGWNSITVDTGEWIAKPFEPCGGEKPVIITLDAVKSPNITNGKLVSKHLPTLQKVESAKANSGGGNSPAFWSNFRGFWPPEGLSATVWNESELARVNAFGTFEFDRDEFFLVGALDPARDGGDERILRFGKVGHVDGQWAIQVMAPISLPVQMHDAKVPIAYQMAGQLKEHCQSVQAGPDRFLACRPECVAVDDSSDGAQCDVIAQEWSPRIIRIAFQGGPSDEQISLEDDRPANEQCRNKRAEMYLFSRSALRSGQLRGVDSQTAREMCSLSVDDSKPLKVIQSKREYRDCHGGKSPDRSDTLVMLLEAARRNGFTLAAIGQTIKSIESADQAVKDADEIYHESNLYQPESIEDDSVEVFT